MAVTATTATTAAGGQEPRRAGLGWESTHEPWEARALLAGTTPSGETGAWSSRGTRGWSTLPSQLYSRRSGRHGCICEQPAGRRGNTGRIPGPLPSLAPPHDRTSAPQVGHEWRRRRPQGVARTGGKVGSRFAGILLEKLRFDFTAGPY